VLELIEEALDEVAFAVEREIAQPLGLAIGLGRDDGVIARSVDADERICVITLLWQIFSGAGFPNQFFCDSWAVGFWRGRPWLAGWIGKASFGVGSSRFWIGWVTKHGDKCAGSTCRG
jgi:hypothetical protein